MIRLRGVTKRYGRRRGVEDIDLEVLAGEVFGYLGPNGAGKTTTIRLALDFLRPDRGEIALFGLDNRREGVAVRRRTGYLPGEIALYDNLTASDWLRFFFNLKGGGEWLQVEELAERLKCPLSPRISALSQGNRRKVGLIQALMGHPELVILDEPTSGLDPLIQHEFNQIIGEARARGQTVFLSSHNLPEVERICDRIGIIRGGRVVAVEKVSDLRQRSLRNVEIRFAGSWPQDLFSRLPGVQVTGQCGDLVKCRVQGAVDPLIKALAGCAVVDFICQYPPLEELFLSYYGEEERAK